LHRGKTPCLSMASVAGVHQFGPCACLQLPPPGRQRTDLFHGAPRKMHRGVRGRLFFIVVEPHSFGGGGRQHRGRRTGTWPQGLLLAKPPPWVAGHPLDRDEEGRSRRRG
jgi:hypothetical protein